MFTGLVQAIGTIVSAAPSDSGLRIAVDPGRWSHVPATGDSIAVSGICLTVTGVTDAGHWTFDAVPQTLALTCAGSWRAGTRVNLEHAVASSTPLGGHIVQGHVDGIGTVESVDRSGGGWRTRVGADSAMLAPLAPQGSVAVDGVSLTVAACGAGWLEVALIPETLARTTLADALEGARVHIEVDHIAKLVDRAVARILAGRGAPGVSGSR
jgi:riboflavin synthase